jgi:hypothetical protein
MISGLLPARFMYRGLRAFLNERGLGVAIGLGNLEQPTAQRPSVGGSDREFASELDIIAVAILRTGVATARIAPQNEGGRFHPH